MLRSQIVVFLCVSFLTLASARVIDRRQVASTSSVSFNTATVTHIATEINLPTSTSISASQSLVRSSVTTTTKQTATNSVSSTATPTDKFDDSGEYVPPPPPDGTYYQNQGADGHSTGFINVSIGAQAGIIIAIVLVGLAIMGGCVWFWNKKQAEWKAALERRRTLRASRVAAAKAAGIKTGRKSPNQRGDDKKPSGLSQMTTSNKSSSTVASKEVKPVEADVTRSQFDVMTPTESESPSWWKRVLPKKK